MVVLYQLLCAKKRVINAGAAPLDLPCSAMVKMLEGNSHTLRLDLILQFSHAYVQGFVAMVQCVGKKKRLTMLISLLSLGVTSSKAVKWKGKI